MNHLLRLKRIIANNPEASAKIPHRFNFSFQIKYAIKVVSRIIPTFISGKTTIAGRIAKALRRNTVVRTFGTPSNNPHNAVWGIIRTFFAMI